MLREVQRGTWRPPAAPVVPELVRDPTFHEFASDWFDGKRGELRETIVLDYEWQLRSHLLPFFARHRLSEITVQEVDRYRESKVREGTLSATSINKTITRLRQILERAVEYELIGRNPARIGNRKLKPVCAKPIHLDSAELICALLDAAKDLDEAKGRRRRAGARSWPRRPSPACGSVRRALCSGATSTWPTAGSRSGAPRRTPGCARST